MGKGIQTPGSINPDDPRAKRISSAAERLHNLPLHGAMVADGNGFGKTKQYLLVTILLGLDNDGSTETKAT